jgi:copper oxidase (laccase) domain-containing protein
MEPTAILTEPLMSPNTRVLVWGQPNDWNFYQKTSVLEEVTALAKKHGATRVFAPNPQRCNRKVFHYLELQERGGMMSEIPVHNRHRADGAVLPIGGAFCIASADCPTIVVTTSSNKTVAAHAGLRCLIPVNSIRKGRIDRRFKSIVTEIADRFNPLELPDMRVVICGGVGPGHYRYSIHHPTYGDTNRLIVSYINDRWPSALVGATEDGIISLKALIMAQFLELSHQPVPTAKVQNPEVRKINPEKIFVDALCTASDRDENGFSFHSNSRSNNPTDKAKRNLVMVIRCD